MKEEILKLAKKCGSDECIPNEPDKDGNFYMHYIELERFYRLAKAQALRDAARMWSIYGTITTDHGSETTEVCRSDNLRHIADDLEN